MKIDRLLGIVMILLQKEKVTAPYLADKFEVSRRTINRDIEDLCKAGIPVVTVQGGNGGISIADGYRIDKSVLTYQEMEHVVAALRGMDSITSQVGTEQLLNKFFIKKENVVSVKDSIIINLSSYYKSELTGKIAMIKNAILSCRLISFRYYSNKGDSLRQIEPYYLTFQWAGWYVFGYCLDRQDFRLFKLNRLWELKDSEIIFQPREISEEERDFERYFRNEVSITLLFDADVKYRLIDEYGIECFTVQEDGKLLFRTGFANKDYMLSWILSFGDKVEVVNPKGLKQEMKKIAENILKHYQ
ncbi:MAG: DNA-binding transcriptional regulator [Herbinix sp.]|jgi:predicted DNA-binding transcriptional regulator YafY|nr:DNA-binding transcriptional regulator [Herbinix sp.]